MIDWREEHGQASRRGSRALLPVAVMYAVLGIVLAACAGRSSSPSSSLSAPASSPSPALATGAPDPEDARPDRSLAGLSRALHGRISELSTAIACERLDDATLACWLRSRADARGAISLENVRFRCEQQPTTCDDTIEQFAQAAVQALRDQPTPAPDQVRAVLKPESFLAAPAMRDAPLEQRPVSRPFVGDVRVLYVFDSESAMRFVSHEAMEQLGLDAESLHTLAVGNMARALGPFSVTTLGEGGAIHSVATNDGYDAARLLLVKRWEDIARQFEGPVVAAVPSRDLLLFTDSANPENLAALAAIAEALSKDASYPVSATLFRFTGVTWEVVPLPKSGK